MARWDYYWNYYTPKPPKSVKNGIKTKSQHGAIAKTWWSKRWLAVLETLGMGARLDRGRRYARQGQVVSLEVKQGVVHARVQGTYATPYQIKIEFKLLTPAEWNKVTDAMTAQAIFVARLLAGEMPDDIEEAFDHAQVPLFPRSMREINTDCSCPDWANPCKHIAAIYFILAERFDEDPFLIFKLRGKSQEDLIAELRQKRGQLSIDQESSMADELELEAMDSCPPLSECLESFWQAGPELQSLAVNPALPEVDCVILKQLGTSPFTVRRKNLIILLEKAYQTISRAALTRAFGDNT